jgi:hypothetical protein
MNSTSTTTLIAWELGGGLGHLFPVAALAGQLHKCGHKLVIALRSVNETGRASFADKAVIVQSPLGDVRTPVVRFPTCLAHVLLNVGFADANELGSRVAKWREVFEQHNPAVVVCDHAPTAQVAAHSLGIRTIRFGTGYCCPPANDQSTRDLRPWRHAPQAEVIAAEVQVLDNVNHVLADLKVAPFSHFDQFLTAVDETFLMTFRELDHFPHRTSPIYWGPAPLPAASSPTWPLAGGPKILAYLKPFPSLPALLGYLASQHCRAIVVGDEIPDGMKSQYASTKLSFPSCLIDIERTVLDCDLTITNATHAVTAASLLGGKPVAMIPIVLEQAILAKRVIESGVGIWAYPHKPADIISAIESVSRNPVYRKRAEEFSARYRDFNAARSFTEIAAAIDARVSREKGR